VSWSGVVKVNLGAVSSHALCTAPFSFVGPRGSRMQLSLGAEGRNLVTGVLQTAFHSWWEGHIDARGGFRCPHYVQKLMSSRPLPSSALNSTADITHEGFSRPMPPTPCLFARPVREVPLARPTRSKKQSHRTPSRWRNRDIYFAGDRCHYGFGVVAFLAFERPRIETRSLRFDNPQ
jgi:hypothetical protein